MLNIECFNLSFSNTPIFHIDAITLYCDSLIRCDSFAVLKHLTHSKLINPNSNECFVVFHSIIHLFSSFNILSLYGVWVCMCVCMCGGGGGVYEHNISHSDNSSQNFRYVMKQQSKFCLKFSTQIIHGGITKRRCSSSAIFVCNVCVLLENK